MFHSYVKLPEGRMATQSSKSGQQEYCLTSWAAIMGDLPVRPIHIRHFKLLSQYLGERFFLILYSSQPQEDCLPWLHTILNNSQKHVSYVVNLWISFLGAGCWKHLESSRASWSDPLQGSGQSWNILRRGRVNLETRNRCEGEDTDTYTYTYTPT